MPEQPPPLGWNASWRPSSARRKGALVAVAGLLLLAVALVTVRYLPSPVPNSELSTPNSQSQPLAPNTQPLPPFKGRDLMALR